MELSSPQQRYHHHHTLSHHHHTSLPSPTSSSSSSSNNNGLRSPGPGPLPSPTTPTVTRSDPSNPYPTTFVQADTTSFKQVVQMLTGSSEPVKPPASKPNNHHHHHNNHPIPPIKPSNKSRPSTKLYERRNNSFKHLRISPLLPTPAGYSPRHPTNKQTDQMLLLSPSMLDFPALVLSPVTPLIHDPFNRSSPVSSNCSPANNVVVDTAAEEKAIADKQFFLHPVSPVSVAPEPRLLPLFPLTSPKVPPPSSSSSPSHHTTC